MPMFGKIPLEVRFRVVPVLLWTRTEGVLSMGAIGDHVPKYRHYKPKNLGVVRIDGRDHYLGKFGTPESYEKYHRLLAERYARWPGNVPTTQEVNRNPRS